MSKNLKQNQEEQLTIDQVFSSLALTEKKDLESIKEKYNSRCEEVFKNLNTDKEYISDVQMNDVYKYNKYDLRNVEYNQSVAAESAIDFITGLRQTRQELNQSVEQRMVHSEKEIQQFTTEFDNKMQIDNESMKKEEDKSKDENFKPKFISKDQRKTILKAKLLKDKEMDKYDKKVVIQFNEQEIINENDNHNELGETSNDNISNKFNKKKISKALIK